MIDVLEVTCPKCGYYCCDVCYDPIHGKTLWKCPSCENKINLSKYRGMIMQEMYNRRELRKQIKRELEG